MKSVLMIGQSNMAGRGFINSVPMIFSERIKVLRNNKWQTMLEPINYDRKTAGVSLASSFSALYHMDNPNESIGLIPCAEGGSTIDEWNVNGSLFENAITQSKTALKSSDIIAVLWHQGESDSHSGNYKTYYNKLENIFDSLRKQLKLENTPFIIGGLADFLGKYGFGAGCTEYNLINEKLIEFANNHNNTYFVTADGFSSNPDGIHIDAVSLRKFGVRYYEAFVNRKSVFNPLIDEQQRLDKIYNIPHTKNEKDYLTTLSFSLGKLSYEDFLNETQKN